MQKEELYEKLSLWIFKLCERSVVHSGPTESCLVVLKGILENIPQWNDALVRRQIPSNDPRTIDLWKMLNSDEPFWVTKALPEEFTLTSKSGYSVCLPTSIVEIGLKQYVEDLVKMPIQTASAVAVPEATPGPVPHIKIQVEYKGQEASQYCAHFIDAIHFLCQCEEAIRNCKGLDTPVDTETSIVQKQNLNKLLAKKE